MIAVYHPELHGKGQSNDPINQLKRKPQYCLGVLHGVRLVYPNAVNSKAHAAYYLRKNRSEKPWEIRKLNSEKSSSTKVIERLRRAIAGIGVLYGVHRLNSSYMKYV